MSSYTPVFAVWLILFLCLHCRADNRVSVVLYQIEDGNHVAHFRFNLAELAKELDKNETIYPCVGHTGMCVKTEKCIQELQQESDAGETMCSILVYGPTNLTTFNLASKTKNISRDISMLEPYTHEDLVFGEMTESPLLPGHPTPVEVWGFGVLSVAIISLSGLFGAVFWPLMKTDIYAQMMWVLIGLAVGSLTASATFQLIPEAFKLKEYNENYLDTALFMWISFWALYMFEALAKIFLHSEPEASASVAADVAKIQSCAETKEYQPQDSLELDGLLPTLATKVGNTNSNLNLAETKSIPLYMSQGSLHNLTFQKSSHQHSHGTKSTDSNKKMATVAWMIIIGDGIHNFIDGMSIGAGFSNSIAVGTSISIAIACEEFPHELGDFAILINSGMSVKRALLFNFLSACTAFAGLVLGILLGEIDASIYIFAFAGGLFLYIALTDLMPELNEMIATGLKKSKKYALFVLLLQNLGIFLGASILYAVTILPINII